MTAMLKTITIFKENFHKKDKSEMLYHHGYIAKQSRTSSEAPEKVYKNTYWAFFLKNESVPNGSPWKWLPIAF